MATATLTANPSSVPPGGSSTITVGFAVQAGEVNDVVLYQDGAERARGTVTFAGEAVPVVSLGSTNTGWELRAPGGTLTALGNNTFRLVA